MSKDIPCTESIIKNQAKVLFFINGKMNASSQEIAEFAGVQRTSLNYYFRSKENLKKTIYEDLLQELVSAMNSIYIAKIDFEEKVDTLIETLLAFKLRYPYFEFFNITEVYKNALNEKSIVHPSSPAYVKHFLEEVQQQIEKGKINCLAPFDFLINLTSLVSYPIILKPLFLALYEIDELQYDHIMLNRKKQIKQLLLKK